MSALKLTAAEVVSAVTEMYIETGRWVSADEIAEHLERSRSSVARVMGESGGYPTGLVCDRVRRTTFDKNYGGARGAVAVNVYAPSIETLRELVRLERADDECWSCGAKR